MLDGDYSYFLEELGGLDTKFDEILDNFDVIFDEYSSRIGEYDKILDKVNNEMDELKNELINKVDVLKIYFMMGLIN